MTTTHDAPRPDRSHWDDLPFPPEDDVGYHLYEIQGAEWLNVGPTPDMSETAREFDAELIRKGYMTIDEGGCYRTTEAGRSRAAEFARIHAIWQKEFDRCLLACEKAGVFD